MGSVNVVLSQELVQFVQDQSPKGGAMNLNEMVGFLDGEIQEFRNLAQESAGMAESFQDLVAHARERCGSEWDWEKIHRGGSWWMFLRRGIVNDGVISVALLSSAAALAVWSHPVLAIPCGLIGLIGGATHPEKYIVRKLPKSWKRKV